LATVIDSLLIELGLDTSKFDAAQKKSVEQLRKFDEANQKTQKNLQKTSKDTAEGFEKARDSLISFGTAAFSVAGFAGFINSMTTTNAALGRNASLFNMSARELDAWGGVLKSVGGTADDFQASIQALQTGVANVQLGNPALLSAIGQLSARSGVGFQGAINYEKNTVDIYRLADAFKKLKDLGKEEIGLSLASQLGINRNTFFVLENGSAVVHKLYDESYKLSGVNEKNVEQAKKLQEEFGNLANSFAGAKNSIMDGLYPTLMLLVKGMEDVVSIYTKASKAVDKFETSIGMSNLTKSLERIMPLFGLISYILDKTVHTEGQIDQATGKKWHSQQRAGGKGFEWVLQDNAQTTTQSQGGSRNERNRNPGNIKYGDWAKAHGATGQDSGGFAIFPDMATGQKALDDLLVNQYYNKGQKSIASIIGGVGGRYPHAYSSTDQSSYINFLSKKLGINPNQQLNLDQLHGMANLIPQFEGMSGARANTSRSSNESNNITSNVQNLNVYTNTNDPNKMLNDIEQAAKNNPIIASGMAGAR